jgi:hypothetical protein
VGQDSEGGKQLEIPKPRRENNIENEINEIWQEALTVLM